MHSRARSGFTIIEMLVVVGIMLLVASITVAAFAPFMKGSKLSAAAASVQGLIWQARSHAASSGESATLCFDTAEQSIALYRDPDNFEKDNRVRKPYYLPRGVSFFSVPADNILVFSPGGSLNAGRMDGTTGNREIVLTDARGFRKVIQVIFASGLTQTYDE